MPPEIIEFAREFGIPATVILLFAITLFMLGMAFARKMNTSSKQDELISLIAMNASEERKQLQESNNRTQAEYMELRVRVAKEEGKFEQFEKTAARERDEWRTERNEWKAERIAFDDKIHKMETRIAELERTQQQSKERIQELEAEIELLNKKLAEANAEISLLQAQKRELESQLEIQRNRADAISRQLQTVQEEAAQASTATLSVDDTATPAISANTQPLPENVTTGNDEADNPAA